MYKSSNDMWKSSIEHDLEEIKEEMRNNYCKYTQTCIEQLDQNGIDKIYDSCPLNRL